MKWGNQPEVRPNRMTVMKQQAEQIVLDYAKQRRLLQQGGNTDDTGTPVMHCYLYSSAGTKGPKFTIERPFQGLANAEIGRVLSVPRVHMHSLLGAGFYDMSDLEFAIQKGIVPNILGVGDLGADRIIEAYWSYREQLNP
jgi:hypothetical protein